MDRSRAARGVLAVTAAAYALAVLAASQSPGPRAWGLHLPGFLPPAERFLVLALLFGGASLLAFDFLNSAPSGAPARARDDARHAGKGQKPREKSRSPHRSGAKHATFPRWTGWLLLLPCAWVLWRFVARTRFLGDGAVWLAGIQSGNPNPFSEPLAAATWAAFARMLRSIGLPIDPVTAGLLPIFCGVLAAAILWGIASEIAQRGAPRAIVFAVLATLGMAQLYFGYIESYPLVSVAILAYLWLGLRRARGADHPICLAGVFALTIGFHLVTVFLAPSFLYLIARDKRPVLQRAVLAVVPFAAAAALLMLLGYPPSRWLGAFQIAARAIDPGHAAGAFEKAYSVFSLDHAWDLLNAILLALPIPAMLLAAALAARAPVRAPGTVFLAVAAVPGIAVAIALVLPVPPAQDWDLTSILFLPLAVLGVKMGSAIPNVPLRGARGVALAAMGAGALLSFVLVNASVEAGLRRFETIVSPGAKVTAYGRAYANELLASHHGDRGDFARALVFAQRALDAEPTNPRYWARKGGALLELGRYEEAIPILQEGIRRNPARDEAYYNLGNCYARLGRNEDAVASYRQAVRFAGPRPDYLNNLGVVLYRAGNVDSARAVWTDAVRRWPDYPLSRRALLKFFGPAAVDSATPLGAMKSG